MSMKAIAGMATVLALALSTGAARGADTAANEAPAGCRGAAGSCCGSVMAEAEATTEVAPVVTIVWEDSVLVYRSGDWAMRIEYLRKGTRSEGQNGALSKAGEPVAVPAAGATLETPFGTLKHYGVERKRLWDITGWNFADRAKVLPSLSVKPTP